MHDTLSGRAEELGRLTDLIRTSLSLADSSIPTINAQLDELAAMGLDNLELEGPLVYSRAARTTTSSSDRGAPSISSRGLRGARARRSPNGPRPRKS
jgi:hypothetical protein